MKSSQNDMQNIVNQASVKEATAVMLALRDVEVGPQQNPEISSRESQTQRVGRPALEKSSSNWNA